MKKSERLGLRNRPTQKRAQQTFDLILKTAAYILEEMGFDKLTTNIICQRANITPPALYRYFPNKYSILEELGSQLMDAQNASSFRWMEKHNNRPVPQNDASTLLREQYEITLAQPGAKWIMRSLRSVPALSKVRLDSHRLMNSKFAEWYLKKYPDLDPVKLERRLRITNEAGYAIIEMLLDGDYDDTEKVFSDTERMFSVFDIALKDENG